MKVTLTHTNVIVVADDPWSAGIYCRSIMQKLACNILKSSSLPIQHVPYVPVSLLSAAGVNKPSPCGVVHAFYGYPISEYLDLFRWSLPPAIHMPILHEVMASKRNTRQTQLLRVLLLEQGYHLSDTDNVYHFGGFSAFNKIHYHDVADMRLVLLEYLHKVKYTSPSIYSRIIASLHKNRIDFFHKTVAIKSQNADYLVELYRAIPADVRVRAKPPTSSAVVRRLLLCGICIGENPEITISRLYSEKEDLLKKLAGELD